MRISSSGNAASPIYLHALWVARYRAGAFDPSLKLFLFLVTRLVTADCQQFNFERFMMMTLIKFASSCPILEQHALGSVELIPFPNPFSWN